MCGRLVPPPSPPFSTSTFFLPRNLNTSFLRTQSSQFPRLSSLTPLLLSSHFHMHFISPSYTSIPPFLDLHKPILHLRFFAVSPTTFPHLPPFSQIDYIYTVYFYQVLFTYPSNFNNSIHASTHSVHRLHFNTSLHLDSKVECPYGCLTDIGYQWISSCEAASCQTKACGGMVEVINVAGGDDMKVQTDGGGVER